MFSCMHKMVTCVMFFQAMLMLTNEWSLESIKYFWNLHITTICENSYSSSILLRCVTVHFPSTKRFKHSIANRTFNPSTYLGKNRELCFHMPYHYQACLIYYVLWSGVDTIINAHDKMQNLCQRQKFYKPGQTYLTRQNAI